MKKYSKKNSNEISWLKASGQEIKRDVMAIKQIQNNKLEGKDMTITY